MERSDRDVINTPMVSFGIGMMLGGCAYLTSLLGILFVPKLWMYCLPALLFRLLCIHSGIRTKEVWQYYVGMFLVDILFTYLMFWR